MMDEREVSEKLCRMERIYKLRFDAEGRLLPQFERISADQAYDGLQKELASALGSDELRLRWEPILKRIIGGFQETESVVCEASEKMCPIWDATQPYVVLRQNTVGHGGFHTGTLGTNEFRVRWVYDCGSWKNNERLGECIEAFRRQASDLDHLQLLFISHFDADHVSGLKRLLEAFRDRIDVVVVPYLSSDDVLGVLGRSLVARRYSADFFNQVVDPVAWLRGYGVKRVIRLRPSSPGRGGPGEPDTPRTPDPPHLSSPLEKAELTFLDPGGNEFLGAIARPGTIAGVNTNQGWADWWFVPFVHPVSRTAKRRFSRAAKQKIERTGKGRTFRAKLLSLLKIQDGRRLLKELYKSEKIGDANAISMSLYEGPLPLQHSTRASYAKADTSSSAQAGWLLTGDAKLREDDRRSKWLAFFRPFKGTIGTVMLPHHGSIHNFHKDILGAADQNAKLFITADANDPTRPNDEVKRQVRRRIRKISNQPRSTLIDVSGPVIDLEHRPALTDW